MLTLPLLFTLAAPPNILLIVADDLRADAIGHADCRTPNLSALAARGFAFSNAYNQGSRVPAVCRTSRTMLLTGKSLFRIPDPRAKSYAGPTLGGVFSAAGYATCCVSKPGNSFAVGHAAFGTVVHQPHADAPTARRAADAAIDFIQKPPPEKPFFVYLASAVPHDPRVAEPPFHALYDPAKLALPKNFRPRHPFDIGIADIRDEKLAATPRTEAEMRQHLAAYYACVTGLDHHVGRVLDAVTAAGKSDNTLVVFTSDSGLAVGGRHGLMGKQNLYEHVKPPLVVAGPGVPKGKSAALAYLFDVFPTLCDFAGVPVPKACEGASLKPVIRGEKAGVRDVLFCAYADTQRMVRDDKWKLLAYPKAGREQLFDVAADPDELMDKIDDPAAPVARLRAALTAERARWGDAK